MNSFAFGRGLLELSKPPFPRTHRVHGTAVRLLEDGSSVDKHGFVR